jgi:hypothetical protein
MIKQLDLTRRLVNCEQISRTRQHCEVSEALANIVFGDDRSRRRVDDREAAAAVIGDEQGLAAVCQEKANWLTRAALERHRWSLVTAHRARNRDQRHEKKGR